MVDVVVQYGDGDSLNGQFWVRDARNAAIGHMSTTNITSQGASVLKGGTKVTVIADGHGALVLAEVLLEWGEESWSIGDPNCVNNTSPYITFIQLEKCSFGCSAGNL